MYQNISINTCTTSVIVLNFVCPFIYIPPRKIQTCRLYDYHKEICGNTKCTQHWYRKDVLARNVIPGWKQHSFCNQILNDLISIIQNHFMTCLVSNSCFCAIYRLQNIILLKCNKMIQFQSLTYRHLETFDIYIGSYMHCHLVI